MIANTVILGAIESIGWRERFTILFTDHAPQLICSMMIGAVLGLLGCFVILRRMSLIGDAISHAVLPGVVLAFLLVSTGITGLFVGALLAGVLTAVGINLVSRYSRAKEDAAIGIVFTAMFALGVILISWLPAGVHFDMKCFLFGDPLAIQTTDLITILIVAPAVAGTVIVLFRPLKLMSFDPVMAATAGLPVTTLHYLLMILLSATVVAALRSVGVIMAVAMLITPAAVGYQLTNRMRTMIGLAAATGAFSAFAGMIVAFQINCPTGPAMVLAATLLFIAAVVLSPQHGLVASWRRRRRMRNHIIEEDVLKALVMQSELPGRLRTDPSSGLGALSPKAIDLAIDRLERDRLVTRRGGGPILTERGHRRALELVRSHRLWETYLAEYDVSDPELHQTAERLEHAHDLAESIADALGQPEQDPHGSPIPKLEPQ